MGNGVKMQHPGWKLSKRGGGGAGTGGWGFTELLD